MIEKSRNKSGGVSQQIFLINAIVNRCTAAAGQCDVSDCGPRNPSSSLYLPYPGRFALAWKICAREKPPLCAIGENKFY